MRFQTFTTQDYRPSVYGLDEIAKETDKGVVLAEALINNLRQQKILLPSVSVIESMCAEAITRASRRIHATLADTLSDEHRQQLDQLLQRKASGSLTWLGWLRQSPGKANSRFMLEHIERLKAYQALNLPEGRPIDPPKQTPQNGA